MTLSDMLQEMVSAFKNAGIEGASIDAKALLTGLLGFTTVDIATRQDLVLSDQQILDSRLALNKRVQGMPVYRILGWREFYGLEFQLSQATLEPRPDTEILVDCVLPYAEKFVHEKGQCKIIDLGTGTGAIALSLLHNCGMATALGVDQADGALVTADKNAKKLGVSDRFRTLKSNWTKNVDGRFDLVVSNPPYICKAELSRLSVEVSNHDPVLALDGGDDGLAAYRALAQEIPTILLQNGIIGLEIGWDQAQSVRDIFTQHGFSLLAKHRDLAGRDRVLLFEFK